MAENESTLDSYDSANVCSPGEVKTPFATGSTIPKMKAMVADSNPGAVLEVSDAWDKIYKHLSGSEGSIKSQFEKAVDHVLQHWEGESADEFAKRAKKVSKSIGDCGTYAQYTGMAMHTAGTTLSEIKPQVMDIEVPGGFSSGMDALGDGFSRNDDNWRTEISGNQGAQQALAGHDGDLSAGREEQLKAAAKMEQLALVYTGQTKMMGSWHKAPPPRKGIHDPDQYPGEPGGIAPVPFPVTPGGSVPTGGATVPPARTGPSGAGKGSVTTPPAKGFGKTPGSGTKVDGITGGTATSPGRSGTPGVGSTGTATVGAGSGSGGPAGGLPGAGGIGAGAGRAGGPGMVGQASGNRGVAGGAANGAGARGGMGGMRGGMGGGIGAGGKDGGANAGGRGPLARQRGGKLDTPEAGKGAEKQGGSGLHSSRGGSAAGQRGRNGMLGHAGMAGRNTGRRNEENQEGQRPDYLVEDEETWMPKRRDVTPPTIG